MAEDNILDYFEREKSLKLPTHIKNLLLFTGFDNKHALAKLESEDIAEIETIARDIIPLITKNEDLDKYLGYFTPHPPSFRIFPGHKKTLQEMSQFYKNFSYRKRSLIAEPSGGENSAKKPYEPPVEGAAAQKQLAKPRDVDGEKLNIMNLLTNWLMNFCSRNLSHEETAHVHREMSKLKVELNQEDPNQCFVRCCICLRDLKIFRNQSGFWIMSNIHKHFKTHLNIYSNKKFSKNISISSSMSQEGGDPYMMIDNDVKQEHEYYEDSN